MNKEQKQLFEVFYLQVFKTILWSNAENLHEIYTTEWKSPTPYWKVQLNLNLVPSTIWI